MRRSSRLIMTAASICWLLGAGGLASAETTTVLWGPFPMPPATSEGPGDLEGISGTSGLASFVAGLLGAEVDIGPIPKPCSNCYITAVRPNMVDANGDTLNFNTGGMLHHVLVANIDEPDVFCRPGFSGAINLMGLFAGGNERFFAAGNERTHFTEQPGYGYRVDSGDDWVLVYHLMNMQPVARDFYFEIEFDHVSSGVEATRPMWVDFDQCDDSERDSPVGYSDVNKWQWKSDRSGYIRTIGGHVHDQGISIAWENVSRGSNIYTSVAGYAAGAGSAPVGPGSGTDAMHPTDYNIVGSDPLGLGSYMGHIADMTVGYPNGRIKKKNNMVTHTQYHHSQTPGEGEGDMGIMIASFDEDFCITDFWCF